MARVVPVSAACLIGATLLVGLAGASGENPLAAAVKQGNVEAVRALIASRADVNVRSGDGSTPLLWAAHHADVEVARVLVTSGAGVDLANEYGVTPLLAASRIGDAAMVDLLLSAGADPARSHPEGETPLMAASRAGSVAAVRILLDRGADANAADSFQGATPLMWASAEGHLEVVDALLTAGADPNRQAHITLLTERHNADFPSGGFTALMFAARNGFDAVVRRLVAGGADLTLRNGDDASAAMIAIYNDRFDMAATLVALGSDPNDGSLYVAVEMRDATTDQFAFDGSRRRPEHPNTYTALDLIRMLLERGADSGKPFTGQLHSTSMPNTDRFDNTPFFRAAIAADVETLKLLVAHGADLEQTPALPPKAEDAEPSDDAPAAGRGRGNPNAGRTAAMVAMTGGRGPGMTGGPAYIRSGAAPYREPGSRKPEDALVVLLDGGANPNAKAPDGSTLLHQAARAGNLDIIRTLARASVDFNQPNADGLTALDVAEGKRPAGAAAAAGGRRGAPPPGARGRGGRGGGSQARVAPLLRELMGLPPAPVTAAPSRNSAGPASADRPAAPAATDAPAEPADADAASTDAGAAR
jgi:ankyrin repeat protein